MSFVEFFDSSAIFDVENGTEYTLFSIPSSGSGIESRLPFSEYAGDELGLIGDLGIGQSLATNLLESPDECSHHDTCESNLNPNLWSPAPSSISGTSSVLTEFESDLVHWNHFDASLDFNSTATDFDFNNGPPFIFPSDFNLNFTQADNLFHLSSHLDTNGNQIITNNTRAASFLSSPNQNLSKRDAKPLICTVKDCKRYGIPFKKKCDLARHQRLHFPPQYRCPKDFCPRSQKGFSRKDKLMSHLVQSHHESRSSARMLALEQEMLLLLMSDV